MLKKINTGLDYQSFVNLMINGMKVVEEISNGKEGRLRDDNGNLFATFIKPDVELDSNIFPIQAIDKKGIDIIMLYTLQGDTLHLNTLEKYTGKEWDFMNKVHQALNTLKITDAIIDKIKNK